MVNSPENTAHIQIAERVTPQNGVVFVNSQQRAWTWFWCSVLFCTVPMLWIYFTRMWRLPHYQYFPFAIAAVGYLAWRRSDRVFHPPGGLVAIASLLVGGLAAAFGWGVASPWLVAIAFVFIALSCLSSMRGRDDKSLVALALPLTLLVRLPLGYDQLLVIKLQQLTTVLSSLALDTLNIPHSVDRNVLNLPGRELFVAEACSGIQSVFTMLFASTMIIVIKRRRLWLTPFYLSIAIFLAVAGNVLRVTAVAAVDHWFGLDWASGWAHGGLGYATLGIALLMLISFDRLIIAFLHPTNRIDESAKHNPIVRLWNWCVDDRSLVDSTEDYFLSRDGTRRKTQRFANRFERLLWRLPSTPFSIVIGIFAIVLTGMSFQRARSVTPVGIENVRGMFASGVIWEPDSHFFDSIDSAFKMDSHEVMRDGEDPVLGNNADVWNYSRTPVDGVKIDGKFVVSQTYNEWHELCLCYEIRQWNLLKRSPQRGQVELEPTKPIDSVRKGPSYVHALFSNSYEQRGYLWFAGITADGRVVDPPAGFGQLEDRLAEIFDATPDNDQPIMMIQLWIASEQKLEKQVTRQIDGDFLQLTKKIIGNLNKMNAVTRKPEQ